MNKSSSIRFCKFAPWSRAKPIVPRLLPLPNSELLQRIGVEHIIGSLASLADRIIHETAIDTVRDSYHFISRREKSMKHQRDSVDHESRLPLSGERNFQKLKAIIHAKD